VTIFQALNWVHQFPANPFHSFSHGKNSGPSLRTLSFLMAETAREEGFPDWVQLVALFHELGQAVKVLDPETKEIADSLYDWTISSRSRIVGCKAPDRASFSEFRHLNTDEVDSRYNTDVGAYTRYCGLDKVCLTWTGCEYMYHLLRHNSCLPDEGLAMVRYFLLGDWHAHYEYSALTNEDDADALPFVAEFDALRRRVRLICMDCCDLSDDQCKLLWEGHYGVIASKYHCNHTFEW
jgi:inositol oxygenase